MEKSSLQLRHLAVRDRFIHAKAKNKRTATQFQVVGFPQFNAKVGQATRKCINLSNQKICDKICSLEVITLPIKPIQ